MARKRSKSNAKRHVMWLTIYLRMAGVHPLPFRHRTQHMYVAVLQRQLSLVRKNVGEEKWQQLRRDARGLVRSSSLETVATGNHPLGSPANVCRQEADESSHKTGPMSEHSAPTASEKWNCRRKLKHADYLSALRHADHLADPDLRIYPCSVCLGLHVGHDPVATRLKGVGRDLADVESRLAALEVERKELERRRAILLERQEKLRAKKSAAEAHIDQELHNSCLQ